VKDNGIGIPSGELPHIFEPGFKGATQRDLPGRGLGLYFAQKLVQKMGGSIWADSRGFHRGVTFSFTAIFEKLE